MITIHDWPEHVHENAPINFAYFIQRLQYICQCNYHIYLTYICDVYADIGVYYCTLPGVPFPVHSFCHFISSSLNYYYDRKSQQKYTYEIVKIIRWNNSSVHVYKIIFLDVASNYHRIQRSDCLCSQYCFK